MSTGVTLFGVRQDEPDAEPGLTGSRGADSGSRETRIGGAPVRVCFCLFFSSTARCEQRTEKKAIQFPKMHRSPFYRSQPHTPKGVWKETLLTYVFQFFFLLFRSPLRFPLFFIFSFAGPPFPTFGHPARLRRVRATPRLLCAGVHPAEPLARG